MGCLHQAGMLLNIKTKEESCLVGLFSPYFQGFLLQQEKKGSAHPVDRAALYSQNGPNLTFVTL
jgi:hypothetical protein